MRALATILVMLIAACGDPVVQPGATLWSPPASQAPDEVRWSGEIGVDWVTGALTAPGFNALIDTAHPGWAKAPDTAAAELLDLDRPSDATNKKTYLHQETERDDAVVTVTLTHLGDDSVDAERYRVVFARGDDGWYRFVSGVRTFRCQPERGHQDFATDNCS